MNAFARPIYTRLDGETGKAFEAFRIYRDMGDKRSIAKVGIELGKSDKLLERWSSKYSWVERATSWDEHLDQVARSEAEKAKREMVKRHIKLSIALQGIGAVKLTEWQKQIQAWQLDPEHNELPALSPSDILRLLELGIRIERLSRGEPSEVVDMREITYKFIPPRIIRNE